MFTPGALQAAAEVALDRKTGARALRSIVEESLLEVMYDIPERTDIRKCIITEETIRSGRLPLLLTKTEVDKGVDETNYEDWLAEQRRDRVAAAGRWRGARDRLARLTARTERSSVGPGPGASAGWCEPRGNADVKVAREPCGRRPIARREGAGRAGPG